MRKRLVIHKIFVLRILDLVPERQKTTRCAPVQTPQMSSIIFKTLDRYM